MPYTCKDCSYRGKSSGQEGKCPACGSYNIGTAKADSQKKPRGKFRLVLLILLWAYLIAHITWKLVH